MYAEPLAKRLNYTNTFFHQEPRLDITVPGGRQGTCDFLIASEVFEHIPPPVSRAFKGAFDILKPGGSFIFSVPYKLEGDTEEHFPDLHDFEIKNDAGEPILINRLRDGSIKTYRELVFHGGDGATLEMRLFSEQGVLRELRDAGFSDIQFLREDVLLYGIVNKHPWSFPLSAKKPI